MGNETGQESCLDTIRPQSTCLVRNGQGIPYTNGPSSLLIHASCVLRRGEDPGRQQQRNDARHKRSDPINRARLIRYCFMFVFVLRARLPGRKQLCKLAERLAGVTPEPTCERCASTASQVERIVGHRNFNAQFLSKRSTIDWACFLMEAKNF